MNLSDQYSWIKEIDYKKHLDDDTELIVEEFGIETYLKLFSLFGKTRIYFSTEPILEMKKEFIKKHLGKYTIRDFTRILYVSEEFIRRVMRE